MQTPTNIVVFLSLFLTYLSLILMLLILKYHFDRSEFSNIWFYLMSGLGLVFIGYNLSLIHQEIALFRFKAFEFFVALLGAFSFLYWF